MALHPERVNDSVARSGGWEASEDPYGLLARRDAPVDPEALEPADDRPDARSGGEPQDLHDPPSVEEGGGLGDRLDLGALGEGASRDVDQRGLALGRALASRGAAIGDREQHEEREEIPRRAHEAPEGPLARPRRSERAEPEVQVDQLDHRIDDPRRHPEPPQGVLRQSGPDRLVA